MGMFQHTIDTKGRLSIPVKFREVLMPSPEALPILTISIDRCLVLYSSQEWNRIKKKASDSTEMNASLKSFLRLIHARANEAPLDKQGRILISPLLRKYANLAGNAYVAGVENRIEIWNPEHWEAEEMKMLSSDGALRDTVASLGL